MTPAEMPIAVRAWASRGEKPGSDRDLIPDDKSGAVKAALPDLGPSFWTLVLDLETTTDPGQGRRVGAYQLCRGDRLAEAGLFYEPAAVTAAELDTLERYAAEHGMSLMTHGRFVGDVFLLTAWERRGLIVGHNLPFDLARLSIDHHPPQSGGARMRGGFGFKLTDDEKASRVQVKRVNSGAAFFSLTIPAGVNPELRNRARGGRQKNHHGYFLDTATLGGAMLGGRPSLRRLADLLETEHRKTDGDHGERITPQYLDYLCNDVQVTWECNVELQSRFAGYQLPKLPTEIYSEASIGKAHLEKMGLRPFRQLNDWPDQIISTVMETYYGGRAECAIRKVPVPGVYVDFASQYPTVFTLQGLDRFLTAESVTYEQEDAQAVQRLLDRLTVEDVLKPQFWREELPVLVQIAPDGDRLPTRARYNAPFTKRSSSGSGGSYNVGVPFRYGGRSQWYTLADACDSKLMTGKAPRVLAAIRFRANGTQGGLMPIAIAGNQDYIVDPAREDFIRRLVELRDDVRADEEMACEAGELVRATALEAAQQAMKITANATSYGSAIELNPTEHRKGAWVTVHLPDGTSYRIHQDRTEQPGRWFHPLIATLVASGGRLLLTAAIRLVNDLGGSYAFCDTDSLFIVATQHGKLIPRPGAQHNTPIGQAAIKALSWQEVDSLVDRFTALDPYQGRGHPKSILEIEKENRDPDTGAQREIECFVIAAKRYGLYTCRPDGTPQIVSSGDKKKRSEHGLGHLLPPNAPSPEIDDRAWLDEWWEHLLHLEFGYLDHPEPTWFDDPAIGRLTVTSQRDIKAFATYNNHRPYAEQVKPWGFLNMAHPAPYERAREDGPRTLIAPFERDPVKRRNGEWIDRDHPDKEPQHIHTNQTAQLTQGSVAVLSYRDYFNQYRQHPESKALDPTDSRRCHTWTRGQLKPWHVAATDNVRVGKESNRMTDSHQSAGDDEDEQVMEYPRPARKCRGCDAAVEGRKQWCCDACRKRTTRAHGNQAPQRAPIDRDA